MLPLKDDTPTKGIPLITVAIIVLNLIVFFFQLSSGNQMINLLEIYGAVPFNILNKIHLPNKVYFPVEGTIITSMFMHGGLFHITGNMLYLWIFAKNIEEKVGHMKFILFYILCGIIAASSHIFLNPDSKVPMVGASGAVAGILGAYVVLYPKSKIFTLVVFGFFVKIIRIRAIIVIGFWAILQLANILSYKSNASNEIAWAAHCGGFIAGIALIAFFKKNKGKHKKLYNVFY